MLVGISVGGRPYYVTSQSVIDSVAHVVIVTYAGVFHAATRTTLYSTIDAETVNLRKCLR